MPSGGAQEELSNLEKASSEEAQAVTGPGGSLERMVRPLGSCDLYVRQVSAGNLLLIGWELVANGGLAYAEVERRLIEAFPEMSHQIKASPESKIHALGLRTP